MKDDVVQNFIDFMETVDEKIKSRRKDKGFDLMVGRYKNLSKEDFMKMINRQVAAFKESRNQTDEPEIDESKAVLRVVNTEEKELDLDNELDFTPAYDKPIKVTRKPRKRSTNQIYEDIPVVEESVDKTEEIKRRRRNV